MDLPRRRLWRRCVDWLRAGYPPDAPRRGYATVLGILHRELAASEVDHIVTTLVNRSRRESLAISVTDIEASIREVAIQEPTPHDVVQITAQLAVRGCLLADHSMPGPRS